jgi:hypothetical protein
MSGKFDTPLDELAPMDLALSAVDLPPTSTTDLGPAKNARPSRVTGSGPDKD